MRTAVVIGSTGLIGEQLVEKLARQGSWGAVIAIGRKSKTWSNPKIRTVTFDFTNWGELELQITSFAGNKSYLDFFCCLGTTIKAAGSQEAFRKVDLEYVVAFAILAQRCQAAQLFVVSALGADSTSETFYNRVKGEMESAVLQRFTGKLHFARPSLLLGDRKDFRFFERMAMMFAPVISPFLLGNASKYKPISAKTVAQAMIVVAAKLKSASVVMENEKLHELGASNGAAV